MSAFVLPGGMPVPDEGQIPMFSDNRLPSDRQTLKELLEVLQEQARALHEVTAANRELVENATRARHQRDATRPPEKSPDEHQPYVPQNKDLRTWGGFVAYFVRLERVARRDLQLPKDVAVTMKMVWDAGGPHPRTIVRIMDKTYGLRANQWPPSTWPAHPPKEPTDKN